jgi:ABC-type transport system involved in multi-copper enzyme maturation permease subunit
MRQVFIIACNTIKALIRKKDLYVYLILFVMLLFFLLSQGFFGMNDISRFIKDIGYTCIWVFSLIIAVTFSARQVPEEISSKTVLPLLAKPVSRSQFLAGRFFGSLFASSCAYTAFYLAYIYVLFLRGAGNSPVLLAQGYILGICFMALTCAVSILLSVFFTYSAAVTLSLLLYFAINYFADSLREAIISTRAAGSVLSMAAYYLMPHYEFFDMRIRLTHSWEPLPPGILLAVIAYTAVYSGTVLYIAHRRISRIFF